MSVFSGVYSGLSSFIISVFRCGGGSEARHLGVILDASYEKLSYIFSLSILSTSSSLKARDLDLAFPRFEEESSCLLKLHVEFMSDSKTDPYGFKI